MLTELANEIVKEAKEKGWDFVCFAALPDCAVGKPKLARYKHLRLYITASGSVEFLYPGENILKAIRPGQLTEVTVGGKSGYILSSVIDRHWFTSVMLLSKQPRQLSKDDLVWMQSVSWRFMQHRVKINPFRLLHPPKRRKLLQAIARHGYHRDDAAAALGITSSAVKGQLDDLKADYIGCEELQSHDTVVSQKRLIALAAFHDQI